MIRLSKCIADSGLCSRRQALRLIAEGRACVNGDVAKGDGWLEDSDASRVIVDGKALAALPPKHYLVYNKPAGVDCNYSTSNSASLLNHIDFEQRVFPIGRLDKDSHGLLLLTNDGELCQQLMHPRFAHPKTYRVRVDTPLRQNFSADMSAGVPILDTVTQPCQVSQTDIDEFEIILSQGLNRQIRRMCKHLGYRVTDLQRRAIMNINLKGLALGQWRELTPDELQELQERLRQGAKHYRPE